MKKIERIILILLCLCVGFLIYCKSTEDRSFTYQAFRIHTKPLYENDILITKSHNKVVDRIKELKLRIGALEESTKNISFMENFNTEETHRRIDGALEKQIHTNNNTEQTLVELAIRLTKLEQELK